MKENRGHQETRPRSSGWIGMISGAMRALILLSAFALGAMPPIPRGIGIGDGFSKGGCCSLDSDSPCGMQEDNSITPSCSSCAANESSPEQQPAPAPSDCQRCVCCLCGIGLPVLAPEIPHVEIVLPVSPEIEEAWFSILLPPAPPPPEVLPLLSFV
jgi:hypothetical protein